MTDYLNQQFGSYRLIRLLGRGAFAEVYLGKHLYLDMQSAIKVLHAQLTDNAIQAFNREIQTLAALVHPHIVRIIDSDVEKHIPFLVMDYAPNGSLRQKYPRGERAALSEVVAYVQQIADALQYAHQQKIIHCDVKPENMLLGRQNEVLLSDFGIALTTLTPSSSSRAPEAFGTLPYMAPEQIEGHPCPASDQYALGIVVYEWLCGERPFEGSHSEIIAQHLMTPPSSLRKKLPELAPAVEKVVLKALAKKPEQRFASVQTFASALERASLHPASVSISRRTLVLSLAALGLTTAVGMSIASRVPGASSVHPSPTPRHTPPVNKPTASQPTQLSPTSTPALGTLLYTYRGHSGHVNAVAWSPDGKYIVSGGDDATAQVWHAENGGYIYALQVQQPGSVNAAAWSPDSKRIASSGIMAAIQVWNAFDGSGLFTYSSSSFAPLPVAWSPDGKRIVSGGEDWKVHVWDATSGKDVLTYDGHPASPDLFVNTVAWSPTGKRIASGGDDRTVQVWDAANGAHIYTYRGHTDSVTVAAWSPDGSYIASGSADTTVQVWEASSGSAVYIYRGHTGHVKTLAWSPDGKRIVSGGDDVAVHIWDAVTGEHIYKYHGHPQGVNALAWSPDGGRIASASDDGTVQIWQAH